MTAYVDHLDLRTAVIERIKDASIAEVFPQLIRLAEVAFNRRLRCREQITTAPLTITGGSALLPTDFEEAIGLYNAAGVEYINQPTQAIQPIQARGYYTIIGNNLAAPNDEELTLQYYARIPTISNDLTANNWLLQRHPGLYLYGVSVEAAKHLMNVEMAQAINIILEIEYQATEAADMANRYSRARVRVQGVTP